MARAFGFICSWKNFTYKDLHIGRSTYFHADETRWKVFVEKAGKVGHCWWLWLFAGEDSIAYVLDPSRSHDVPQSHFSTDAQGLLRQQIDSMATQRDSELADSKLHDASRKALVSLSEHWIGLTLFIDDSRIPLDNNYGERLIRNPAVGRKNYYGSGSEWSGRLAMMMFSIFATLQLWKINPRDWLNWYFEGCAANRGNSPNNIEEFLPWNLSEDRLTELQSSIVSAITNTA